MLAITDIRIPHAAKELLGSLGARVISLPPSPALAPPVASHPDMLIFFLGETLLTTRAYYEQNAQLIDEIAAAAEATLLLTDEQISDKYPRDVLLNAAVIGKHILGNERAVSRHILSLADMYGYKFINVKQGYSKCSVVAVSDNALITADRGIAEAAAGAGIDALLIREGYVRLEGYNVGFIGGASGAFDSKVVFCGDIDIHPDVESIRQFCRNHGKEAISLCSGELIDVGTMFFM